MRGLSSYITLCSVSVAVAVLADMGIYDHLSDTVKRHCMRTDPQTRVNHHFGLNSEVEGKCAIGESMSEDVSVWVNLATCYG